jgi:flagellar basal body-associated protein FliL
MSTEELIGLFVGIFIIAGMIYMFARSGSSDKKKNGGAEKPSSGSAPKEHEDQDKHKGGRKKHKTQ